MDSVLMFQKWGGGNNRECTNDVPGVLVNCKFCGPQFIQLASWHYPQAPYLMRLPAQDPRQRASLPEWTDHSGSKEEYSAGG